MFNLLRKILLPVEVISLVVAGVGIYLSKPEALMIGLSTLAAVYFLNAFMPIELAPTNEKGGFLDLLGATVGPKVAWIACSVTIIGVLFMLLHLKGGDNQLTIGVGALGISILLIGVYVVTKPDGAKLFPILYRAVPVCLFGVYILMNKPV